MVLTVNPHPVATTLFRPPRIHTLASKRAQLQDLLVTGRVFVTALGEVFVRELGPAPAVGKDEIVRDISSQKVSELESVAVEETHCGS